VSGALTLRLSVFHRRSLRRIEGDAIAGFDVASGMM
jgi:hypothetical protein